MPLSECECEFEFEYEFEFECEVLGVSARCDMEVVRGRCGCVASRHVAW